MPPSSTLIPDFRALVQWDARTGAPPLEVGKGRLKELRTLGHKIERFLMSRAACVTQAGKAGLRIPDAWGLPSNSSPGHWEGDGLFACAARLADNGMLLSQPLLPAEMASRLAALWQRVDRDAPRALPPALAMPGDANDPIWLALLRLRPLCALWERELRRATLESLLDALPDAWVLDPAPLPPGAVIPRLELAAWEELARLSSSGRRFVIAQVRDISAGVALHEKMAGDEWRALIRSALDNFATEPRVLIELADKTESAPPWVIGFYERRSGSVDALGFVGLSRDEEGKMVAGKVGAG